MQGLQFMDSSSLIPCRGVGSGIFVESFDLHDCKMTDL